MLRSWDIEKECFYSVISDLKNPNDIKKVYFKWYLSKIEHEFKELLVFLYEKDSIFAIVIVLGPHLGMFGSLLSLHAEISQGSTTGSYRVLRIEPRSATCKINTLLLTLWQPKKYSI